MRGVGRFLVLLAALVFLAAAWVFAVQNREDTAVRFASWIVHLPMALALFTAFLLGAFLALLAVVPRWWAWRVRYHFLHRRHARLASRRGTPQGDEADAGGP